MNARRRRAKLKNLHHEQNGLCKWCGKECFLFGTPGYLTPAGKMSKRAATIDHVYHALDPRRKEPGGYKKIVMACAKCNRRRGDEAMQEVHRQLKRAAGLAPKAPTFIPPFVEYNTDEDGLADGSWW